MSITATPIAQLLNGSVPIDQHVCINGWVRSKRTSKGGFSFIHVNDGSCLANIQAVADESLANYTSEVSELGTGCAVQIEGTLVASQGRD